MSDERDSQAAKRESLLGVPIHLALSNRKDSGVEMDEKSDVSSRMDSRWSPDLKFLKSKDNSDTFFSPLLGKKVASKIALSRYLQEDSKKFRSVEKKEQPAMLHPKPNRRPNIAGHFKMVMVGSPMGEATEELIGDISEYESYDIDQFKIKVLMDESKLSCEQ